jgi:aminopeptidase N
MDIKNISVVKASKNIPLKYKYEDSLQLNIHLDKTYTNAESYTIYIDYTAKPNELKAHGSAAITDAKGLYFINPDGTDKNKPIQIWTQGETESSSAWFPTIDKPNQKTTEEISMTVQAKYTTLSNGKLVSQKANADGTRTDTWKQDLPHSPYLFMMAVGDFKVYHDKWRDKPVDYYLEPKYAPYAKQIFGMTPEIIDFYSKTLGVDYPWYKYGQIVVRDYVSGAMENTTATLHGTYVQGTPRELADAYYNDGRSTIAHELFHQWFGDYVTAESWSNITVNESFADFSETLWAEHKYGQDAGDAHSYDDMQTYLRSPGNYTKNLVRFYYKDKEDVFDAVSYKKGGTILNMLRNYLGRDAFYKGLGIYLKTNAFKNGEAQQLRLALEEASGRDLNWFFNQWYYGAGHPVLNISYKWDDATKTQTVYLKQTQTADAFTLPMAIDIYQGGKKVRHNIWLRDKVDSVKYQLAGKPDLVNVDADKKTTTQKTDEKTLDEFAFQYFKAPLYVDRYEAINAAIPKQSDKTARKILLAALKDKYYELQIKSIRALDLGNDDVRNYAVPILASLAQNDANNLVKAAAITALGKLKASGNMNLFKQALADQSYAVEAAALTAIVALDPSQVLPLAKSVEKGSGGALTLTLINIYADNGGDDEWAFVNDNYKDVPVQAKFPTLRKYAAFTSRVKNPVYAQQGIATIKTLGIQFQSAGVGPLVVQMLNNIKDQRAKMGDTASAQAADDAMKALGQ